MGTSGTLLFCAICAILQQISCSSVYGKPTDHAKVARDIVHKSNWASFGTNSGTSPIVGFPMVDIIAIADSALGEPSTGNIYFMLTDLEYTAQDLMNDNRVTLMFSQDQDLSCTSAGVDAMEPTCARVSISGRSFKIPPSANEYQYGFEAFVGRHPAAHRWMVAHKFELYSVAISSVIVMDWYGPPHHISIADYHSYQEIVV